MAIHNLPVQSTAFIGRTTELTEIGQLLAERDCRLLTLVGPGGSGKTRLAIQIAAEQIVNYADGVFFVPLAPVNAPDMVAPAIAAALKVSFYGQDDPAVQIVRYLGDKNMLLLLDNFEHLLPATTLLTDILANAANAKLLLTSRERLNLQEEWGYPVDGLPFPDPGSSDEAEKYSAVELFVQSARRVHAHFSLAEHEVDVVAICQQVEGMPLGLELAATWLRVMPCSKIATQIQRSLDFLTTPVRNMPERHRSLRGVFEQSWKLLSDDEKRVLSILSIFRGGFDEAAAEKVAGASLLQLADLIDKSMIRLNPTGRYDLHELSRQFAAEKLAEAGQVAAAARHHFEYYSSLAEQTELNLYGAHQEAWFDRLETELDNLQAALAWSVRDEEVEAGLRLAGSLGWFWELRSHHYEGYLWLKQLLANGDDVAPMVRSRALRVAAVCGEGYYSDGDRAHQYAEESLALARESGDRHGSAWALAVQGWSGREFLGPQAGHRVD